MEFDLSTEARHRLSLLTSADEVLGARVILDPLGCDTRTALLLRRDELLEPLLLASLRRDASDEAFALASAGARLVPAEISLRGPSGWDAVWTLPPEPLIVFRRDRLAYRLEDETLHIHGPLGVRRFALSELRVVETWANDFVYGVRLALRDGRRVRLVRHYNLRLFFDPTYATELDFAEEIEWTRDLARRTAEALGVPLTLRPA